METKTVHDSETPAHGQQVITACAFIHHSFNGIEKLFLAKRVDSKKFLPGIYELPGGHIDFGEDIVAGLKREVREKLAKTITVGDPFRAFTYTNHVKGSHSIEVVYFAQFEGPIDDIVLDPDGHSAYGWFTEEEAIRISSQGRDPADPEIDSLKRGFALLRGKSLHF